MKYFVTATYRENDCNSNSAIKKLHLDPSYDGRYGHDLKTLKPLADKGQLVVKTHAYCNGVKVRIFESKYYGRWIATTSADDKLCNNLLSLPIFYNSTSVGTTYFHQCQL